MIQKERSKSAVNFRTLLTWGAAVTAVLVFICIATRNLRFPGLYYDECIFVNAALGGISDGFVDLRILNIPVMIMPYIGALKSYLYFPVFKAFTVSPESIRLPIILLSTGTLAFSFLLARRLFGAGLALLYLALLATDPAFIFNIRLDSGPVALMLFFKTCALYFFFMLLETKSARFAWLLVIALSLGIFDKLNFIWFIIALGVSGLCFFGADLKDIFVRQRRRIALPIALFLLVLGVAIVRIVNLLTGFQGHMPDRSLTDKILFVIDLYKGTMNGSSVYHFLIGGPMYASSWVNYLLVPVPLLLIVHFLMGRRASPLLTRQQRCLPWFWLTMALLIFLQIIATREVGGAHHLMMLHPLHHLLIVSLASASVSLCNGRFRKSLITCFLLVTSVITYSQLKTDTAYLSAFAADSTFNKRWDPQIYTLSDYLKDLPADYIISTDWGIHTQLFCLADASQRLKYFDASPTFMELPKYPADWQQSMHDKVFVGRNVLVITHTKDAEIMAGSRDNLATFASRYCKNVTLEKVFLNSKSEGLYEVYRVND